MYTYCLNSSTNRIDPSGFDSWIFYGSNDASVKKGKVDFERASKEEEERLKELYPNTNIHRIFELDAKQF